MNVVTYPRQVRKTILYILVKHVWICYTLGNDFMTELNREEGMPTCPIEYLNSPESQLATSWW